MTSDPTSNLKILKITVFIISYSFTGVVVFNLSKTHGFGVTQGMICTVMNPSHSFGEVLIVNWNYFFFPLCYFMVYKVHYYVPDEIKKHTCIYEFTTLTIMYTLKFIVFFSFELKINQSHKTEEYLFHDSNSELNFRVLSFIVY